jgi:hypothetical protein
MYAVVANLILARVGRPHDIRVAVIGSVAAISTVYAFINGISGVRDLSPNADPFARVGLA